MEHLRENRGMYYYQQWIEQLRVNISKNKENPKNVATIEKSILLILWQFEHT